MFHTPAAFIASSSCNLCALSTYSLFRNPTCTLRVAHFYEVRENTFFHSCIHYAHPMRREPLSPLPIIPCNVIAQCPQKCSTSCTNISPTQLVIISYSRCYPHDHSSPPTSFLPDACLIAPHLYRHRLFSARAGKMFPLHHFSPIAACFLQFRVFRDQ